MEMKGKNMNQKEMENKSFKSRRGIIAVLLAAALAISGMAVGVFAVDNSLVPGVHQSDSSANAYPGNQPATNYLGKYDFLAPASNATIDIDLDMLADRDVMKSVAMKPVFLGRAQEYGFKAMKTDDNRNVGPSYPYWYVVYDATSAGGTTFRTSLNSDKHVEFPGELFHFTYKNAATLPDGSKANLRITYSDAQLVKSKNATDIDGYLPLASGTRLFASNSQNNDYARIGWKIKAKVQILDDSDKAISTVKVDGRDVPATFYFPMVDIDVFRKGSGYDTTNPNTGLYDDNNAINRSFSEQVRIEEYESSIVKDADGNYVYIPGPGSGAQGTADECYGLTIVEDNNYGLRFYNTTNDQKDKDPGTYRTGFVAMVDNTDGVTVTWWGSGSSAGGLQTLLCANGHRVDSSDSSKYHPARTVWHKITSESGLGGTIETTAYGNKDGRLDVGTYGAVLHPGTYLIPEKRDHTVYTMTPDQGFEVASIEIKDVNVNGREGSESRNNNKTIISGDTLETLKINGSLMVDLGATLPKETRSVNDRTGNDDHDAIPGFYYEYDSDNIQGELKYHPGTGVVTFDFPSNSEHHYIGVKWRQIPETVAATKIWDDFNNKYDTRQDVVFHIDVKSEAKVGGMTVTRTMKDVLPPQKVNLGATGDDLIKKWGLVEPYDTADGSTIEKVEELPKNDELGNPLLWQSRYTNNGLRYIATSTYTHVPVYIRNGDDGYSPKINTYLPRTNGPDDAHGDLIVYKREGNTYTAYLSAEDAASDTNSQFSYTYVPNGWYRHTNGTFWEESDLPSKTETSPSGVQDDLENRGTASERVYTTVQEHIVNVLPRFDEDGGRIEYIIRETLPDGTDVAANDPTKGLEGYVTEVTEEATTHTEITTDDYEAVKPATGDNPATKGWYEYDTSTSKYVASSDSSADPNKKYYVKSTVKQNPETQNYNVDNAIASTELKVKKKWLDSGGTHTEKEIAESFHLYRNGTDITDKVWDFENDKSFLYKEDSVLTNNDNDIVYVKTHLYERLTDNTEATLNPPGPLTERLPSFCNYDASTFYYSDGNGGYVDENGTSVSLPEGAVRVAFTESTEGGNKIYSFRREWDDATYTKVEQYDTEYAITTDPSARGWYEKSGNDYILTGDTAIQPGKDYYRQHSTPHNATIKFKEYKDSWKNVDESSPNFGELREDKPTGYHDGMKFVAITDLGDGVWEYEVVELPAYINYGGTVAPAVYYIAEDNDFAKETEAQDQSKIPGKYLEPSSTELDKAFNNGQVTNTERIVIKANKKWEDNDNALDARQDIALHLDATFKAREGSSTVTGEVHDILPPYLIKKEDDGNKLTVVWGDVSDYGKTGTERALPDDVIMYSLNGSEPDDLPKDENNHEITYAPEFGDDGLRYIGYVTYTKTTAFYEADSNFAPVASGKIVGTLPEKYKKDTYETDITYMTSDNNVTGTYEDENHQTQTVYYVKQEAFKHPTGEYSDKLPTKTKADSKNYNEEYKIKGSYAADGITWTGTVVDSGLLTSTPHQFIVNKLPRYDAEGNEISYSIRETLADGSDVAADDPKSGLKDYITEIDSWKDFRTVSDTDILTKEGDVTNTLYRVGLVGLTVDKTIKGRQYQDTDDFVFVLTGKNNTPMPVDTPIELDDSTKSETDKSEVVKHFSVDADNMTADTVRGTVDFGVIAYTLADLEKKEVTYGNATNAEKKAVRYWELTKEVQKKNENDEPLYDDGQGNETTAEYDDEDNPNAPIMETVTTVYDMKRAADKTVFEALLAEDKNAAKGNVYSKEFTYQITENPQDSAAGDSEKIKNDSDVEEIKVFVLYDALSNKMLASSKDFRETGEQDPKFETGVDITVEDYDPNEGVDDRVKPKMYLEKVYFENVYDGKTKWTPEATKILNNRPLERDQFSFILKGDKTLDESGNEETGITIPMPENADQGTANSISQDVIKAESGATDKGTNDLVGPVKFGDIEYTNDDLKAEVKYVDAKDDDTAKKASVWETDTHRYGPIPDDAKNSADIVIDGETFAADSLTYAEATDAQRKAAMGTTEDSLWKYEDKTCIDYVSTDPADTEPTVTIPDDAKGTYYMSKRTFVYKMWEDTSYKYDGDNTNYGVTEFDTHKDENNAYEIKVLVERKADGTITATPDPETSAIFTNEYKAEGDVQITLTKQMDGRDEFGRETLPAGSKATFKIEKVTSDAPLPSDGTGRTAADNEVEVTFAGGETYHTLTSDEAFKDIKFTHEHFMNSAKTEYIAARNSDGLYERTFVYKITETSTTNMTDSTDPDDNPDDNKDKRNSLLVSVTVQEDAYGNIKVVRVNNADATELQAADYADRYITLAEDRAGNYLADPSVIGHYTVGAGSIYNTYNAAGRVDITAEKKMTGRTTAPEANQFYFQILELDKDGNETGRVIDAKPNAADGKVTFDSILYDLAQVRKDTEGNGAIANGPNTEDETAAKEWTYKYKVKEIVPSENGRNKAITYDESEYIVTVKVTDKEDKTLETAIINVEKKEKGATSYSEVADKKIIFTNEDNSVDIKAEKIWNDSSLMDGTNPLTGYDRPKSVSVKLTATPDGGTEEEVDRVALDTDNSWTHTWEKMPQYDDDGNLITYKVSEVVVPDGYTVKYSMDNATWGTTTPDVSWDINDDISQSKTVYIQNTPTVEEIKDADLTLLKKDAVTGKAMESISFALSKKNTETGDYDSLGSASTDANGKAYFKFSEEGEYKLVETVPTGYNNDNTEIILNVTKDATTSKVKVELEGTNRSIFQKFFDLIFGAEDGVAYDAQTKTLTVENTPNVGDAYITKKFVDEDGNVIPDDAIPAGFKIDASYQVIETDQATGVKSLKTETKELTKTNRTSYDSATGIYSWKLENVVYNTKVTAEESGYEYATSDEKGYTYVSTETTITGKAGSRISHSADSPTYAETVVPAAAATRSRSANSGDSGTTDDSTATINFVNKYKRDKGDLDPIKVWNDGSDKDGVRPASITFTVNAEEGNNQVDVFDDGQGGKTSTVNVTLTKADNPGLDEWKYSNNLLDDKLYNLPTHTADGKRITYVVVESNVPAYYTCTGSRVTTTLAKNATKNTTITNEHTPAIDNAEIAGTKKWVDGGIKHDNTTEVVLTLERTTEIDLANFETAIWEDVTDESFVHLDWKGNTWTFANLPEKDKNGTAYTYRVKEKIADVKTNTGNPDYQLSYSNTGDFAELTDAAYKGGVIENKLSAKKSLTGTKTWVGGDSADHVNTGLALELWRKSAGSSAAKVDEITVDGNDYGVEIVNWSQNSGDATYTFGYIDANEIAQTEVFDKYDDQGNEYTYTVENESGCPTGYTPQYDGMDVSNVLDPTSAKIKPEFIKKVEDMPADIASKEFTFLLAPQTNTAAIATDDADKEKTVTVTGNGEDNQVTFDFDDMTFTKAGTYTYKLVEKAEDGWTSSAAVTSFTIKVTDNNGVLSAEIQWPQGADVVDDATDASIKRLRVTNTYDPKAVASSVTDDIDLTKALSKPAGVKRTLKAEEFNFTMKGLTTAQAGAGYKDATGKDAAGTNKKDGTVEMSAVTFNEAGKYAFEISEDVPTDKEPGMTYATTKYKVEAEVKGAADGKLTVTWKILEKGGTASSDTAMSFENRYDNLKVEEEIFLKKILEGRKLKADEFDFILSGDDTASADNQAQQTVKNTVGGNLDDDKKSTSEAFSFENKIPFTLEDLCDHDGSYIDHDNDGAYSREFVYKLFEKPGNINGVTYDGTVHELKATLKYVAATDAVEDDPATQDVDESASAVPEQLEVTWTLDGNAINFRKETPDTVAFNNKYDPDAITSSVTDGGGATVAGGTVEVKKHLEVPAGQERSMTKDEFVFELLDKDDNRVAIGTNKTAGVTIPGDNDSQSAVSIAPVTFTKDMVEDAEWKDDTDGSATGIEGASYAELTYTIKEIEGNNKDDLIYDTHTATVKAILIENDGKLQVKWVLADGQNAVFTNRVPVETIDKPVRVSWINDTDMDDTTGTDQSGINVSKDRPTAVTVTLQKEIYPYIYDGKDYPTKEAAVAAAEAAGGTEADVTKSTRKKWIDVTENASGDPISASITLNSGNELDGDPNNWGNNTTWVGLPKYDDEGVINYRVIQTAYTQNGTEVSGGTADTSDDAIMEGSAKPVVPSGYTNAVIDLNLGNMLATIVNRLDVLTITGTKTWVDPNPADHNNSSEIKFTVKRKAPDASDWTTLTEGTDYHVDWSDAASGADKKDKNFTIRGLTKYVDANADENVEYEYEVSENAVDDRYTTKYYKADGTTETTSLENGGIIKNTIKQENVKVYVSKKWVGDATDDVTFELKADGASLTSPAKHTFAESVFDQSDSADFIFEKDGEDNAGSLLPKYKFDGDTCTVIKYSVVETPDGTAQDDKFTSDGPTGKGTADDPFVITNTNVEKTTIYAKKEWAGDSEDTSGRKEVKFQLYQTVDGATRKIGEPIATTDETAPYNPKAATEVKWENQPKSIDGKAATYTIKEVEVPEGYIASEVSGEGTEQLPFVIRNTLNDTAVDVAVRKVWDDNDNQDGERPDSVSVRIYIDKNGNDSYDDGEQVKIKEGKLDDDGTVVADIELNPDNNWKRLFKDLPATDANGKAVDYLVAEMDGDDAKVGGDTAFGDKYTVSISGNMNDGYVIKNSNAPDTIAQVQVTKVWAGDNNDAYGLRTDVILHLYGLRDGLVVYDAGTKKIEKDASPATATWSDLPKRHYSDSDLTWQVVEEAVPGYVSSVTGNIEEGFTVTNTYEGPVTEISVSKEWNDSDNSHNTRPDTLTYQLYKKVGDGDEELVEEKDVTVGNDGSANYTWQDLPVTAEVEDGEPETTTRKEYQDVTKYQKNDDESDVIDQEAYEALSSEEQADYTEITVKEAVDVEETVQKTKEVPVLYYVKEKNVNGYSDPIVTATAPGEFTAVNNLEIDTVDINVVKVWNDDDNDYGVRPDHIGFKLKVNGDDYATANMEEASAATDEPAKWEDVLFRDVPVYDGDKIELIESTPNGYSAAISEPTIEGDTYSYTVTNTYNKSNIDLTAVKVWEGDDKNKAKRKDVTFHLMKVIDGEASEVEDQTKTIKADRNVAAGKEAGSVSWTGLPEKEDGKDVSYYVKEDAVSGYSSSVSDVKKTGDANKFKVVVTNKYIEQPAPSPDATGDVIYIDPRNSKGSMIVGSTKYGTIDKARAAADAMAGKPKDPSHKGVKFLGWDLNVDENGNFVFVALYSDIPTEVKRVVSYIDPQSGKILISTPTDDPSSVNAPPDPSAENMQFVGWEKVTDAAGNTIYVAKYACDCRNGSPAGPKKEDRSIVKTGDDNDLNFWIFLFIMSVSFVILTAMAIHRKKAQQGR